MESEGGCSDYDTRSFGVRRCARVVELVCVLGVSVSRLETGADSSVMPPPSAAGWRCWSGLTRSRQAATAGSPRPRGQLGFYSSDRARWNDPNGSVAILAQAIFMRRKVSEQASQKGQRSDCEAKEQACRLLVLISMVAWSMVIRSLLKR